MNKFRSLSVTLASLSLIFSPSAFAFSGGAKKADLQSDKGKLSYAIGQQIGGQMKAQGVDIDTTTLAASIDDALAGKEPRMKREEIQAVFMKAQQAEMAKQQAEMAKMEGTGKENKEKGDKYLSENKGKPGVKTTKSGLQYEVLTAGKGASPKAADTVRVHYKGTLLDGTEFDSSYKRGEPVEFALNRVIPGWTEGLQLMKVGGKNRLTVPSDLAYGPQGRPSIPPNSVLIFEVELIDIVKPGAR